MQVQVSLMTRSFLPVNTVSLDKTLYTEIMYTQGSCTGQNVGHEGVIYIPGVGGTQLHFLRVDQGKKDFVLCQSSREKAMAPHSSTLAWKIPWMEEPGRLQSTGLLRVGHD